MNSTVSLLNDQWSQRGGGSHLPGAIACDLAGSPDAEIAVQVEEHLAVLSDDVPFDIEARVLNGEVFLRGIVCSPWDRLLILNVVSQIPGIQGTHDRLAIFEDGKMCEDDAAPPGWFDALLVGSGLLVILACSVFVSRWLWFGFLL